MINQTDTQVLTAIFGEDAVTKLSGAFSSDEEVSLDLRLNGKLYSTEEQKAFKDEAIVQGKELRDKEYAKEFELTLAPGEKDPKIIADKVKTSLSTAFETKYKNQTPTEEVLAMAKKATEYEAKYNQLFDTHKDIEGKLTESEKRYVDQGKAIEEEKLNNKILGLFPEKMTMDRADALLITRNTVVFEKQEDDSFNCLIGGKLQLNNVGNPETPDNVIKSLVEKKGWIKVAGMGGQNREDSKGQFAGTMSPEKAREQVLSEGLITASVEGLARFKELLKK